eukprot:1146205-Pelagomonas_calceolata.AAC.3
MARYALTLFFMRAQIVECQQITNEQLACPHSQWPDSGHWLGANATCLGNRRPKYFNWVAYFNNCTIQSSHSPHTRCPCHLICKEQYTLGKHLYQLCVSFLFSGKVWPLTKPHKGGGNFVNRFLTTSQQGENKE